MLNVIVLNVVMLSVVAPLKQLVNWFGLVQFGYLANYVAANLVLKSKVVY
jgi:hypothetical protein